MIIDRLSPQSKAVIELGSKEAQKRGNTSFGTEHLLLGLLAAKDIFPASLLNRYLTYEQASQEVERMYSHGGESPGKPEYTPRMKEVLYLALDSSIELDSAEVEPVHLALGLLASGREDEIASGVASRIIRLAGADRGEIEEDLLDVIKPGK